MTRLYYDPPEALYMLERHGMTFADIEVSRSTPPPRHDVGLVGKEWRALKGRLYSQILALTDKYIDPGIVAKAYPDESGLALLVPCVGDYVKIYGRILEVRDDEYEDHGCETETDVRDAKATVILRRGVPFIMPQREDVA